MSESDFVREVDEELRDEQLRNLWDKFGPYVIGFAVLIVLATAADKGYEYWRSAQAAKSGDAYLAAIALSDDGKQDEAIAALETLKSEGTGGYPLLADMRIASELASQGKADEAIALYDRLAVDPDNKSVIQDLARIRANILLLDQGKTDQVINQLTGLMDTNGFRHSARELVLLAHLQKNDFEKATPIAERIAQDAETPPQLRQRAEIYANFIRSKFVSTDNVKSGAAEESAQ